MPSMDHYPNPSNYIISGMLLLYYSEGVSATKNVTFSGKLPEI